MHIVIWIILKIYRIVSWPDILYLQLCINDKYNDSVGVGLTLSPLCVFMQIYT